MYKLKLYIIVGTRVSRKLLQDLKAVLEKDLEEPYSLEVIDVLENPQKAVDEGIFATPMLVKVYPPPVRKVICDLSHKEILLKKLDLAKGEESIALEMN